MKIYDISEEVFTSRIYPGDEAPAKREIMRMERGDSYNLTAFSMCAHNGTHIDAPFHFIKDGRTVDQLELEKMIGPCYVTEQSSPVGTAEANAILDAVEAIDPYAARRILIKGDAVVTEDGARAFAERGVDLIGVESLSVGPVDAPMAVHLILLENEVVLLEGLRLDSIDEGVYFLSAAPLSLAGSDGSPCRAVLIKF